MHYLPLLIGFTFIYYSYDVQYTKKTLRCASDLTVGTSYSSDIKCCNNVVSPLYNIPPPPPNS